MKQKRKVTHNTDDKIERLANKAYKGKIEPKQENPTDKELREYIEQKIKALEEKRTDPKVFEEMKKETRKEDTVKRMRETTTIRRATIEDEKQQYVRDLFIKTLEEKDKIRRQRDKEWIPRENNSIIKKWTTLGPEYTFMTNENIEQPVLLLMRVDGTIQTFENVKEGLFKITIEDNAGNEETKGILLTADKLQKLEYGKEHIKMWIAHENEATPYPQDVQHDSNLLVAFIEKIILNFSALDENGPKGIWAWLMKALPWIAGAAIIIYLLIYFKVIPNPMAKDAIQAGINATNITMGQATVKPITLG